MTEQEVINIIRSPNCIRNKEILVILVPWIWTNTPIKFYKTGNICHSKANRLRQAAIKYFAKKKGVTIQKFLTT